MKSTIPNYVFSIFLMFLTVIIGWFSSKGKLTDERKKNWWEQMTKRGRIVFFLSISTFLVIVIQSINGIRIEDNLKQEQQSRDSIITSKVKIGVTESNQILFGQIAEAFKDQNFKIDTIQNGMVILKDSIKTLFKSIPAQNSQPILRLTLPQQNIKSKNLYLQNDSLIYYLSSYNSTSYNIDFLTYIIRPDTYQILQVYSSTYNNIPLGINQLRPYFLYPLKSSFYIFDKTIVFVKGKYSSDPENNDQLDFIDARFFDFKNNQLLGEMPDIKLILKKLDTI